MEQQYTPQLTKWQTQMLISQYEKGCTERHICRTLRITKQTLYEKAVELGLVYGCKAKEKAVRVVSEIVIPEKIRKARNQKEEYLPADRQQYRASGELKHGDGRKVFYG